MHPPVLFAAQHGTVEPKHEKCESLRELVQKNEKLLSLFHLISARGVL